MRTAVGEKPPPNERLVEQQVEVVALDKDRVVVETAMRLDVAVAVLVGGRRVGRAVISVVLHMDIGPFSGRTGTR